MKPSELLERFKPACKHLRNKEMYYQPAETEENFASGAHWCAKTQECFGPDGEPATAAHCCSGRACHVE
jgi:hypothetical protein